MPITNDVKLKARTALKPYLEGNYPENVKNPILLLNYLYQHAVIPRPNYNTTSRTQGSLHSVSCKIENLEMTGTGNTTKLAKRLAAQKFLEYLLEEENQDEKSPRIGHFLNGDMQPENHYILEKPLTNVLFYNSTDVTKIEASISNQSNGNFENYFDPFFKSRPVNEITENDTQPNLDQSELKTEVEKPSSFDNKNVFAILQKKTQKHLKLIPRFRIDSCESGFRCRVQLGSYDASGEGKNKKEAKTNAAINLLSQMKDLN